MEDKKMLNEEELNTVNGGFEFEGQEYDSVELLDRCTDLMYSGDFKELLQLSLVVHANRSQFFADIEKAGREIHPALLEYWAL